MAAKNIWIFCTMDTKKDEGVFLKTLAEDYGFRATLVDVGTGECDAGAIDVDNRQVALRAGVDLRDVAHVQVRADALQVMSEGTLSLVKDAMQSETIDAAIAIGGSGGLSIVADAFCALPFGMPKVMASSVASGNVRPYIRGRDIFVFNPVADLIGLNYITRASLTQAMSAIKGMLEHPVAPEKKGFTVAITSFGATDPAIQRLFSWAKRDGIELVAFHARGVSGGMAMEELVRENMFDAVLDVTTTELADLFGGGVLACDESRFDALIETGTPFVISTGALDMVNFAGEETVPERLRKTRKFIRHGKNTILMRTNVEENEQIGNFIVGKLKRATNWRMVIPTKGFSVYAVEKGPFYDSDADRALIETIRRAFPDDPRVVFCDAALTDEAYTDEIVKAFRELTAHLS